MRISDWSSDVCSSDLQPAGTERAALAVGRHLVHAAARRFLLSVRAEPVEAPFFIQRRQKTEQPFDKLRANGFLFSPYLRVNQNPLRPLHEIFLHPAPFRRRLAVNVKHRRTRWIWRNRSLDRKRVV